MTFGGIALRLGAIALRAIEFGASAVALAIYSYFLAVLKDHDLPISNWKRAVEGMSGAAVLYTIFGLIFTVCLGGVAFFGFLAIVLDICFIGCFIAIAFLSRHGANSCTGMVNTPLGNGPADSAAQGYGDNGFGFGKGHDATYLPNLHTACRLNTAVFAVSVINCFLFAFTALYQVALVRHHRKEKRFGPSPANNYTSGSGRGRFWKRNRTVHTTKDAELATALPGTTTNNGFRPSQDTGYTSTTLGGNHHTHVAEPKFGQPGYGQATNY